MASLGPMLVLNIMTYLERPWRLACLCKALRSDLQQLPVDHAMLSKTFMSLSWYDSAFARPGIGPEPSGFKLTGMKLHVSVTVTLRAEVERMHAIGLNTQAIETLSLWHESQTTFTDVWAPAFSNLRTLSIVRSASLHGLAHLSACTALRELHIVDCVVANEEIATLAGLEGLKILNLVQCRNPIDLGFLSACAALEFLSLEEIIAADVARGPLQPLPALRTLMLCECDADVVDKLINSAGLEKLHLSCISALDVGTVHALLRQSRETLEVFTITGCSISFPEPEASSGLDVLGGAEGPSAPGQEEALAHDVLAIHGLPKLRALNLTEVSDLQLVTPTCSFKALPAVTALDLYGTYTEELRKSVESAMIADGSFAKLERLGIVRKPQMVATPPGLEAGAPFPSLRHLAVGEDELAVFEKQPDGLESLCIYRGVVEEAVQGEAPPAHAWPKAERLLVRDVNFAKSLGVRNINLTELSLCHIEQSFDLPPLASFSPALRVVRIDDCPGLTTIRGLAGLPLRFFMLCDSLLDEVNSESDMKHMEVIAGMPLEYLHIEGCSNLEGLGAGLRQTPELRVLSLVECDKVGGLRNVQPGDLPKLDILELTDESFNGATLQSIRNFARPRTLTCTGLGIHKLLRTPNTPSMLLSNVQFLELKDSALGDITALAGCRSLRRLSLCRNKMLQNLDGIESCAATLELLDISETAVTHLDKLEGFTELRSIVLIDCGLLRSVRGLRLSTRLQRVFLVGCCALESVQPLSNLPDIHYLIAFDCDELADVSELKNVRTLHLPVGFQDEFDAPEGVHVHTDQLALHGRMVGTQVSYSPDWDSLTTALNEDKFPGPTVLTDMWARREFRTGRRTMLYQERTEFEELFEHLHDTDDLSESDHDAAEADMVVDEDDVAEVVWQDNYDPIYGDEYDFDDELY